MTENQRNYLADLANQKGVRLKDTGNVSAAWASAKIEELKLLPDAIYDKDGTDYFDALKKRLASLKKRIRAWTLQ